MRNNGFIKNVFTLMSGTTFAQLLSILASPLLSRIFSPEDFALQASFVSVTSLCLVFCSGKLEQAILLPEDNNEAEDIVNVSIFLCFITCFLLPIIITILGRFNIAFREIVTNKLILISIVFVFCSGICEILRVFFLRHKQFKSISSRTVLVSCITVFLNLFCGYFLYSNKILVTSTTIAQVLSLVLFVFLYDKFKCKNKNRLNFNKIRCTIKKYWQFTVFIMPGQIFNVYTGNIPVLLLANYYSMNEIGQYAFANKIVNVPFSVIVSALTQVFLQKFIITPKEQQLKLYLKTSLLLFGIIIVPAIVCVLIAPFLFRVVFGSMWEPAADISRVLAPMLVVRFALTPLEGAAATALNKLWVSFFMQVFRFICVIVAVIISIKLKLSFNSAIFLYSLGLILFYVSYYLWEIFLLKKEKKKNMRI